MTSPEDILEGYYEEISHTILAFQSPTLGLFPRGQSGHARVKDNVYCAMSIWSLALAYRHVGNDSGRVYELEQTAVKCMRGLLFCYLKQAGKLEKFKQNQSWYNALHVRFDCETGEPATQDEEWGHLQIDAPSIFLLALAQMTVSGLKIVLTLDEVDFIQNLVYYIERAYRIPDHGMWERGTKENTNKRELHASSLAMAKAAMEAINGINMLGYEGSSLSVVHVDPDAHYRNVSTLNTLLPKESSSKDTDAALLCVLGFPAFAIDDKTLARDTYQRVVAKLEGRYGLMRFAQDIHHTVKEDKEKVEYGKQELDEFAGIECQWPMLFIYIYLTAMFEGRAEMADTYWDKTVGLLVDWKDEYGFKTKIVPKYYYVPERETTATSHRESVADVDCLKERVPSTEEKPFLWAQALYLIARLIRNKFITVSEIDPIGRSAPLSALNTFGLKRSMFKVSLNRDVVIQVALISESQRLQTLLATHGIPTQTPQQVEPIEILPPSELVKILEKVGCNDKLKLSGRPLRPVGGLGTSRVYHRGNTKMMFYPNEMDLVDFYMSLDILLLIDHLKTLLHFIQLHWNMDGRPTMCLFLRESIFKGSHFSNMISFLADLKNGLCGRVKIRLDRLQALISTSCIEHLDYIVDSTASPSRSSSKWSLYSMQSATGIHLVDDFSALEASTSVVLEKPSTEAVLPRVTMHDVEQKSSEDLVAFFKNEPSVLGRAYILKELIQRHGESHRVSFGQDDIFEDVLIDRVNDLYGEAGGKKDWSAVRFVASMLRKQVDSLSPSVTALVVREKELTIGVFNCEETVIVEPLPPAQLKDIIYGTCYKHDVFECVLQQELIIYLSSLLTVNRHIFDGMLRIRIGWIIQAMKNELERSNAAENKPLHALAPNEVKQLLMKVLKPLANDTTQDYLYVRQLSGALGRVPIGFYSKVYDVLKSVEGGLMVRGHHLPQLPTILELLGTEKTFYVQVEEMLGGIGLPEYRQAIVELLMVVHAVLERNPELVFTHTLDLDKILAQSIEMFKSSGAGNLSRHSHTTLSVESISFYAHPPHGSKGTVSFMTRSVVNKVLVEGEVSMSYAERCSVS